MEQGDCDIHPKMSRTAEQAVDILAVAGTLPVQVAEDSLVEQVA